MDIDTIKLFLDKENLIGFVGATIHKDKWGYKKYKELKDAGFKVYPVNPRYSDIYGDICYPNLKSLYDNLNQKIDVVITIVPPNITKRIVKHPKGHLRDSGLIHYLQRIADIRHLQSHPKMGNSWECMVIEHIIKSLEAHGLDFNYYHYRTAAGAEIDLILEGKFGLVPVEIKYTSAPAKSDISNIKRFMMR